MSKRTVPIEKVCPTCGQTFLVCPPGKASRTYPDNDQIFCSVPCSSKARFCHGRFAHELAPLDAAYIAGFLDGEGSFIFFGRNNDRIALRLIFTITDRSVLEWIAEVTGVGSIIAKKPRSIAHKTGYSLQCYSDAAASVISQLLPFLHIKQDQAKLALSYRQRLADPNERANRSWQEDARLEMQYLNRRGPDLPASGTS